MRIRVFRIWKRLYEMYFMSNETWLRKRGCTIGKGCSIASRSFGSEPYLITIGDYVQITAGVKIFTHGVAWMLVHNSIEKGDFFGKVNIGNKVYIGNNALILPGVTISDNVIVSAGSVVAKSVPSGWIVGGNPAKKIGTVDSFLERMSKYNLGTYGWDWERKKKYLLSLEATQFIMKGYIE